MDLAKILDLESLGNVKGKRVLVRADFNVPLDDAGNIRSGRRIEAALPTVRWLLERGARVILMSHMGRPKGIGPQPEFSLDPVAVRLSELLGFNVPLLADCVGEAVRADVMRLTDGRALLLENLRFRADEQEGNRHFGEALASLGEIYVNDAFGTCHRGDASMTWPARLLPHAAGRLVKAECKALGKVTDNPERPYVAVVGGAKVKDKIPLLNNLLPRLNEVCIGGGMAYTFLKARGEKIGGSLLDESSLEMAAGILEKARELDVVVHLPTDHIVSTSIDEESAHQVEGDIPDGMAGFDIGDHTAMVFSQSIARGKTILFNGPVGVFEKTRFRNGTQVVVHAIADATDAGAFTVVGGGDSAAAVETFGCEERMSHVSTGGGASLALLEGGEMPGIEALLS